jgi:hypothetical protein
MRSFQVRQYSKALERKVKGRMTKDSGQVAW